MRVTLLLALVYAVVIEVIVLCLLTEKFAENFILSPVDNLLSFFAPIFGATIVYGCVQFCKELPIFKNFYFSKNKKKERKEK